jgi:hypothetical protein
VELDFYCKSLYNIEIASLHFIPFVENYDRKNYKIYKDRIECIDEYFFAIEEKRIVR